LFGWKIAATSEAGQKHINVDGPMAGRILAETVIQDGGTASMAGNEMRVAEPEFAFRMRTDLPARSTLFEEYDRAKDVYVILRGEITLAICEKEDSCRQIGTVGEGDLMGWSKLVGRARLYDTARTLTEVKVLAIDGNELIAFCEGNPAFGYKFMQRVACTLAERLSGTRLQLLEMSGVHLPKFQLESD
jgi:CRP-like cAMP-binding protein